VRGCWHWHTPRVGLGPVLAVHTVSELLVCHLFKPQWSLKPHNVGVGLLISHFFSFCASTPMHARTYAKPTVISSRTTTTHRASGGDLTTSSHGEHDGIGVSLCGRDDLQPAQFRRAGHWICRALPTSLHMHASRHMYPTGRCMVPRLERGSGCGSCSPVQMRAQCAFLSQTPLNGNF
jgi:hypothetical protein